MSTLPIIFRTAIITIALLVGIALIVLRTRGESLSASIFFFALSLTLAACLYAAPGLMIISTPLVVSILNATTYFIITLLPIFVLAFSLEYKSHRRWLSPEIFALLAAFPVLTLLLSFLRGVPVALYAETARTGTLYIPALNAWGWINFIYATGILAAVLVLFILPYNTLPLAPLKSRVIWTFSGAIGLAVLINLLGFSGLVPAPQPDLLLAGFALIGTAFIIYTVGYQPLEIGLIARDEVLLGLGDGVIVLNGRDNIIDMNTAAEQIIGRSISEAYGKPIDQVTSNWNNLIHTTESPELEFRGSVYLNQQWRYLSVRLSPIHNSRNEEIGKTIILRDITDRKNFNEDRQRARDEMFVFLRTLFNESGNTRTTSDFLRNALFQIAYTFNVQNGAIFLLEQTSDIEQPKFVLLAKHGPLSAREGFLSKLHESLSAIPWIMENRQPLIVPDARHEPRLREITRQVGPLSVGFFPLVTNQQVLGLITLARTDAPAFNSDEIVRLNIVSEELASYLQSDRQKQMNIIVAERQRLGRDLHDSVTQKLYGLVTFSEVIQMELESGATNKISEHVASISLNARQALREMRLFLHELQPVDLEHEGFISILQQRLVAVEGHSDIQTKFLTGKNISVPKDKEVSLYFIAQEALNNIIKHAQAKSVLVKLTQRNQSLYLTIVDDGLGFDTSTSGQAGLGMKNMYTRAEQIGARLTISSSIGKGTKITLVVPK